MAPARNILRPRRHYGNGTFPGDTHLNQLHQEKASVIPNLMADDDDDDEGLRRVQQKVEEGQEDERETAGTSSSKVGDESYQGWLELGISTSTSTSSAGEPPKLGEEGDAPPTDPMRERMELSLFPDRPSSGPPHPITRPTTITNIPVMLPAISYRWDAPWEFPWRPMASTSTSMLPSSSTTTGYTTLPLSRSVDDDMRVVSPPPRPRVGLWFVLRASQNQVKEPFLPQISKSYLRIKDGRMSVLLLMKYMANKLGLYDESEVEITCRGRQLPPSWTLQHVRDNIWCLSEAAVPSTGHLMILEYSRRA